MSASTQPAPNGATEPTSIVVAPGVRVLTLEPASINAIIVHSDAHAILVDTGTSPSNAHDITAELERLDLQLDAIVITHSHWDHCFALIHFPDVPSYAHPAAIANLREHGIDQREELIQMLESAPPEWLLTLVPAIPTVEVADRMTLRVGAIDLELVPVGSAHTEGDLIVHVPGAEVTLTGDLIEVADDPWVEKADHAGWLGALELLEREGAPTLVPGHGLPTDHTRISHHRALLQAALNASSSS